LEFEPLVSGIAEDRARQLGFCYWAYSAWGTGQRECLWSVHNLPADLWAAYVAARRADAHVDSLRSAAQMLPLLCDLSHLAPPAATSGATAGPLLRLARQHGIACALHLPLQVCGHLAATLVLASPRLVSDEARLPMFQHGMQLLAELHALCSPQLAGLRRPRPARPALTLRERECLHWVSLGKTSWEIGRLLDISEHTARFHLRNARDKLSASNRQQAVSRAIQLGYLS
jgi:DNA-binding CsgD family transcriptional regulator